MLDEVMHRVRVFEELVKARLEVDVVGLVAGARARLESSLGLREIPVEADLADRRGPLGWGRVQTTAWEAAGFRKIVLSQIAMKPVIEGFALVLLPEQHRALPVFACDLMALPTRVSVNVDVYGPEGASLLRPLGAHFAQVGSGPEPRWATHISSGVGLHAKVSPRRVEDGFAALTAALARYLEVAAQTTQKADTAPTQKTFFQIFHAHGPRRGALGRLFGQAWAERYSRLIFA